MAIWGIGSRWVNWQRTGMRRRKIKNVWNLKGKIAYSRKNEKKKMTFSENEKKSVVKYEEDRLEEIKKENQDIER